jgi:NTE family protein
MTDNARLPQPRNPKVALVLQGGGALGSYQAGVFEVLARSRCQPAWVAGISIGAINAALIAGNAPGDRVDRLREFWHRVAPRSHHLHGGQTDPFELWRRAISSHTTILLGQPGFFHPRPPLAWLGQGPTSFYDTAALRQTLERLVDFDRIGAPGEMRLSVGAVNVRTAQFSYFDSDRMPIRAEHVMASGALPPGFPPVEIDGEGYWDGGLVSNTPLSYVLDHVPRESLLIFQVDLFQARGKLPETLHEVAEREKDIRYASRTRISTELHMDRHKMRHAINALLQRLPPELRSLPEAQRLQRMACMTEMDIVQMIYRPFAPQGATKDYEFSHETMLDRWQRGMEDATLTLSAAPWSAPRQGDEGVRVFDVIHDMLKSRRPGSRGAGPEARQPPAQAAPQRSATRTGRRAGQG